MKLFGVKTEVRDINDVGDFLHFVFFEFPHELLHATPYILAGRSNKVLMSFKIHGEKVKSSAHVRFIEDSVEPGLLVILSRLLPLIFGYLGLILNEWFDFSLVLMMYFVVGYVVASITDFIGSIAFIRHMICDRSWNVKVDSVSDDEAARSHSKVEEALSTDWLIAGVFLFSVFLLATPVYFIITLI